VRELSVLNNTRMLVKSRIEPIFAWPWGTLIACLMAGKGFPPITNTFLAVFSTLFITASVYIYNDYIDREMDRLNFLKKNRPLVTGEVPVGAVCPKHTSQAAWMQTSLSYHAARR